MESTHELLKTLRELRKEHEAKQNDDLDKEVEKHLIRLQDFLKLQRQPVRGNATNLYGLTAKSKDKPDCASLYRRIAGLQGHKGPAKVLPTMFSQVNPNDAGALVVEPSHLEAYTAILGVRGKTSEALYTETQERIRPTLLACYPHLREPTKTAPNEAPTPPRADYRRAAALLTELKTCCALVQECTEPLRSIQFAITQAEQADTAPKPIVDTSAHGVIEQVLEALVLSMCTHFALGDDTMAESILPVLERWMEYRVGIIGITGKYMLAAAFVHPQAT